MKNKLYFSLHILTTFVRNIFKVNPLSANFTKWSTNYLSVFDHFVGLAIKGLRSIKDFLSCSWKAFLIKVFFLKNTLKTFDNFKNKQKSRGVITGWVGGRDAWLPTSISELNKVNVSVSNIRDIAFNRFSEIIWTRHFTIFTLYATIFRQYTAVSHFF